MAQDTSNVVPSRLELDDKIKFRCYPGISCFTKCCSNIDIMLTPYDVLRMKVRLGLSSTDFLEKYTRSEVEKKTGQPQLFIRMNDDQERYCPFVTPGEGCNIYTDRPAACRYYPVGQVTHRRFEDEKNKKVINDEFYCIVKEEHCRGFDEEKEWTVDEWRHDQDASLYDEMNREWKDLLMKRMYPGEEIDEKKQAQFYIASYDIDRFRRFVFESRFLEVVEVDPDTLAKIKKDELELMRFSFKYLKFLFGMDASLQIREGAAQDKNNDAYGEEKKNKDSKP